MINKCFNILILMLAWILFVIGLLAGLTAVIMWGKYFFQKTVYSFILILLPLLCVAFIRVGWNYLQKKDFQNARAVAAMFAVFLLLLVRVATGQPDLDSNQLFIVPLLTAIVAYSLLMLGIHRIFRNEPADAALDDGE